MNDPTRSAEAQAGSSPEEALRTPTLTALRELLQLSAHVGPTIARRAGLSESELDALELLTRSPVGPADIARHLGVTTAASSGIVDRLVSRGHVVRRPHASDGRRTEVLITDSGRAEVIGHLMPMFTALLALDRSLSPADAEVVEAYLRGAIDALRRVL